MSDSEKKQWGGKRPGAGRPRNECVRAVMAELHSSRSTLYRSLARVKRLTPEAIEFGLVRDHGRFITGKALEMAGEFDGAEEQIAVLKMAIERRKARKRLSLVEAIMNWEKLRGEAKP